MTTVRDITVIDAGGTAHRCSVSISDVAPWSLQVTTGPFSADAVQGRDLFDALCRLREQFEERGEKIVCAGARLNVFPSGMSREMAAGRKAYVMRLGHQAREIVDIFDPADALDVATVAEQAEFRNQWIKSLQP